jgi:hypothetical protein
MKMNTKHWLGQAKISLEGDVGKKTMFKCILKKQRGRGVWAGVNLALNRDQRRDHV